MADMIDGVPVNPEVPKAVTDDLMSALNQQADQARRYYEKLAKQIKKLADEAATTGETKMAEVMTPSMIMGAGTNDGLFGGAGAPIGDRKLTVMPGGSNLIDGAGFHILQNHYESITVISRGKNWHVI